MDNNIPDWKGRTALATTNNYDAGKIAGEYLKTVLKNGDTLGILEGVPGVPSLDDRVNGMLEGLEGVEVNIVGTRRDQLHRGARDQRRRGPPDRQSRPQGDLFRLRPAGGRRGAGDQQRRHRQRRHHPGRLRLLLRRGRRRSTPATEDATVAQFPAKMAELGVDALVKAIRGEKVESLIDSGAALVTKDNMADFQ